MRMFIFIVLGILGLGFAAVPKANAATVSWQLQGVTFGDGGQATGSFLYDANSNTYSNISISTGTGSAFAGATYVDEKNGGAFGLTALSAPSASDLTGENFFVMQFSSALTNSGGILSLLIPGGNNREGTCNSADCLFGSTARNTSAGSVVGTVIPLPPSLLLLPSSLALLLLGGWRRRKSQKATV
ncbi:MAG: hypothetical protein OEU36_20400 [Gammaproteobacteria bacterium]|nr:hypothetical protein [Gammaproteobacteria bacterium]